MSLLADLVPDPTKVPAAVEDFRDMIDAAVIDAFGALGEHMDLQFQSMKEVLAARFDGLNARLDARDAKLDALGSELNSLRREIDWSSPLPRC